MFVHWTAPFYLCYCVRELCVVMVEKDFCVDERTPEIVDRTFRIRHATFEVFSCSGKVGVGLVQFVRSLFS